MDSIELTSAFETEGIGTVPIAATPRRQTVGRKPFPIVDLRTRSEEAYLAASGDHSFDRHRRFLDHQYADDVPLKDDPIFVAEQVTLFRGSVWHRGRPVLGSVHAKQTAELARWAGKIAGAESSGKLPRFAGTSAIIQAPGSRNYFHWMTEMMPRLLALRAHLHAGGRLDRILLFYPEPAPFIEQSIAFMFADIAPLVELTQTGMCAVERCLFFIDPKHYVDTGSRMKTTTALLMEAVDGMLAARPRGLSRAILISRADAPTRRLVNEALVLEALAEFGLERVALGALDVRGQMELMADARLIVGAHGAGLTNSAFCRPGTAMLEITSTQYIRRCRSFADIAMIRGMPYALAVVDQHGTDYVIRQNRGNDLELAPERAGALRDVAATLLAEASTRA
jgi:capsular polysaccharide biosynthesis protein